MKELKDLLNKIPYEKIWVIPVWQRWLAIGGVVFLFFVIYYFVSYKGNVAEIEKLITAKDGLKTEYDRYAKYIKKMPQLERDIARLNIELNKARMKLPNAKEIPELLTLISNTGTEEGLEFLLFKPYSEEKVDFYAKVPVEMVIVGDFHNVAAFFDKVKKLPRIVDISEVKINTLSKEGRMTLRTSCKAVTYKYMKEAALKTKSGNGGKKKKKKK